MWRKGATMTAERPGAIVDYFAEVVDPRVERTEEHPLVNILVIRCMR
jgi:hypothetical protein